MNKPGHRYVSAQMLDRGQIRQRGLTELPLSHNSFIVVNCRGSSISALVDTGACKSLVASAFYMSMRNRPKLDTRCITTFAAANSDTLQSIGQIDLALLVGSRYIHVTFHVVPRLLHDMILGRDCLAKYKAKIDYQKEVIQLDTLEGLFSVDDFRIPPRSQMWVKVKLRNKHKDMYTGASVRPNSRHSDGAILPGRQLVKIARGSTRVLCRNPGSAEIKVQSGTKLGLAQVAETTAKMPLSVNSAFSANQHRVHRRTDMEYRECLDMLDMSNTVLNAEQIGQIREVIWRERDVMSVNEEIGKLEGCYHEIKLLDDTPFEGRPYRLSPPAREVMRKELQHHYEQDVIEPFMSCYNSPCLLVKKPAYKHLDISKAKVRLVVDLRTLNQRVVPVRYSLPHVVESVTQIDKASLKFISLVDLNKAFSHVPLHPNSYKYVTFRTDGLGTWALKRLPMG